MSDKDEYSGHERRSKPWHEDGRTVITVIVALLLQAGGIIWWASGIEHRMSAVESERPANHIMVERVVRMETLLTSVDRRLNEMNGRLESMRLPRPERR